MQDGTLNTGNVCFRVCKPEVQELSKEKWVRHEER
jgi:hypothetical protein